MELRTSSFKLAGSLEHFRRNKTTFKISGRLKVLRERGMAKLRSHKKTGGVGSYKQQISRDVTIRQPVEL